jgi:protein arginine kinase activator
MKCEICQQRPAEVAVKRQMDGVERELFVCRVCASQEQDNALSKDGAATAPSPSAPPDAAIGAMVEMLLGAAIGLSLPDHEEPRCPACGMGRAEFRKRGRVGCAICYRAFARDLAPMLRDMHAHDHHVGKTPVREQRGRERITLASALDAAIKSQRYEEAARLRDRLRALDAAAPAAGDAPRPAPGGDHAAS